MDINTDLPETPTKDAAINVANHLLKEFRIPTRVVDIQDISSSLFVVLYESLFSDRLPDIIRQPTSRDDETHNCQIVIDILATDVIHDSLSHIRGADIVAGDLTAIFNLLDIFSHLLEYVMNKIESDHEDTRLVGSIESDCEITSPSKKRGLVLSKKIPDVKETKVQMHSTMNKEGKVAATYGRQRSASLNKNENRKAYDDHKIITHEEFYAMTYGGLSKHHPVQSLSPIRPDPSQSLLGQRTIDSEIDTETKKLEKVYVPHSDHPKTAWDDKPVSSSDGLHAVNATVTATSSVCMDNPPQAATVLSSSMSPLSQSVTVEKPDTLCSTIGPVTYHTHPTPDGARTDRTLVTNRPNYYRDLSQLVKKTAAMTMTALDANIEKSGIDKEISSATSIVESRTSLTNDDLMLAQELNTAHMSPSGKTGQDLGGKKKVAFASSQSEVNDEHSELPDSKYYRSQWNSEDSDQDGDNVHLQQELRRMTDADDRLSLDEVHQKPKSSKANIQTNAFARHLALNRQSELGAAHMTLKNEDLIVRKKHKMLRKFYEKDHEEFVDDVEYMLGRDQEKAAETEQKFVQKCAGAAAAASKQKSVQKVRGTSGKPTRKKSKMKIARYQPPERDIQTPPHVTLEGEEDLLPFLMDEFPYLHLSEHTWHELWRKGIRQIETLTQSYQEIERNKSRAQTQLTDAAERHNMLSEIMRKQLEHTRRMQEIKEHKQYQIQIRNKSHEKRIQSARARRYYNEYQVRARAKILKKRTKEEMVFRELFKDTLNIQRERIKDIRKYATDQRQRQEQQRQNEIDSLENYYHNQFEMLSERLSRERFETEIRDAAQRQMMDRMKRELREKMESEIRQYQEQMFHSDEDANYRQDDADRLKQYLHVARYSVKI
uniref:DUF5745 domain-containing protein n=1 Tax=Arion vulgaris TaxID=1028688 RepID=A0A0B7AEE1_9EUPU